MMLGALMDLIGIASGNLENLSMMVNRYSVPELDLGRGPTNIYNDMFKWFSY